jgi:hypothetical protein
VGPTGVPWVVNSTGNIFRRTTADPASGTWELLPGLATDIGINIGNYAWKIGTTPVGNGNLSIEVWDEQSTVSEGSPPPPAKNEWIPVSGGATSISVTPNGAPWVVNRAGNIFWPVK